MNSAPADMLPEPTLSFTLPSIHDNNTTLECRVYHPQSLSTSLKAPPWRKHAAIVAHPYATLGGCFDDQVVHMISATLLHQGFLVGTFNFRYACQCDGLMVVLLLTKSATSFIQGRRQFDWTNELDSQIRAQ